jgi:endonuclease/exonuclease/phosphatase family metal-dependent hydrolase
VTERGATHVQVNRELLGELCRLLAAAEWDVALLQECPPRWWQPLAEACEAEAHGAHTSRNSLAPLRALAARLNPDLIGAGEGGSNLTLVRGQDAQRPSAAINPSYRCITRSGTLGEIIERREVAIHTGRPERRAMAFTRIAGWPETDDGAADLCVANLHATNDRPQLATEDVLRAAATATAWAGEARLLFGGDLNLRPAESPAVFAELSERFGLTAPTDPNAIDHLLVRGLDVVESPRQWPPEQRELREAGLALRLSDHAPVEARFATRTPRG